MPEATIAIDTTLEGGPQVVYGILPRLKEEFPNTEFVIVGTAGNFGTLTMNKDFGYVASERNFSSSFEGRLPREARDSGVTSVKAYEVVQSGDADALVTFADTRIVAAILRRGVSQKEMRRVFDEAKPGLTQFFPGFGNPRMEVAWGDLGFSGGNNNFTPAIYANWAIQMSALYTAIYGVEKPKVGILSTAHEPGKQKTLRRETYELLLENEASGLYEAIGFTEPGDAFRKVDHETPDVIVTDGDIGNLVLKTAEAVVGALKDEIIDEIPPCITKFLGLTVKLSAPEAIEKLKRFKSSDRQGAYILGKDFSNVDRTFVGIKGHGSSDSEDVYHSVRRAREAVLDERIMKTNLILAGASDKISLS